MIRKLFLTGMADATPDFENLKIRNLIYYLNTIRTYDRERNAFVPKTKIKHS